MNNFVTVYELLGLIKDGKAPKKIMYNDNVYEFNEYDYRCIVTEIERGFVERRLIKNYNQNLQSSLNEKVEILEEDKHIIESISIIGKDIHKLENLGIYNIIEDIETKLNEVIDYINRKEDK